MAKYVLVDNAALKIIKGADSVQQLVAWADVLIPKADYLVMTTSERRPWAAYNIVELAMIASSTTGKKAPVGDFPAMLGAVVDIARDYPTDSTTYAALCKRLGREPGQEKGPIERSGPNPEKEPKAKRAAEQRRADRAKEDTAPPRSSEVTGTHKRPKGGLTGRVWEIADTCAQSGKTGKELRADIVAKCAEEGLNPSMAATQYSRWKKTQGAG